MAGYPTLTDLKTRLGVGDTSLDTPLTRIINAAVAAFESATGRVFVAAQAERTLPVERPYWDGGVRRLWFGGEITAVNTLTAPDGTEITETQYWFEPPALPYVALRVIRTVTIVTSVTYNTWTLDADWGYSADPPADVFDAILDFAHHLYLVERGYSTAGTQAISGGSQLIVPDKTPERFTQAVKRYMKR